MGNMGNEGEAGNKTDFRRSAERKNHVQRDTEKKLFRLLYRYGKTGRGVVYRKSPPPPFRHTEHKYQSPLSNFPRKKNWKNKRKKRNPLPPSFPFFVLLRWCERTPGIFPPIFPFVIQLRREIWYIHRITTRSFSQKTRCGKKDRKYRWTVRTNAAFFFQFLLRYFLIRFHCQIS